MITTTRFINRREAGRLLADQLQGYARRSDVLVLALPRGGVPVAYEIAQKLRVPLDVLIVRKIGVPVHPELAMGAIASGGVQVLNRDVISQLDIDQDTIERATASAQCELDRRETAYRPGRPALDVRGRTVLLVDDGLATGATMRAAVQAMRKAGASRVVVAVPVAPAETALQFQELTDEFCCLLAPYDMFAISAWYETFDQVSDQEVRDLMQKAEQDGGQTIHWPSS